MTAAHWEHRYASDELPWDTGRPSHHLVEFFARQTMAKPRRVLEVGCGTGTNSLWMAARGYEVTGIDIAQGAITKAEAKREAAGLSQGIPAPAGAGPSRDAGSVKFMVGDFLAVPSAELGGGPFDFVFDRGVLHVFDDAESRARFAARVAELLAPGGHWLSLVGSTEGPARDHGPPRRSVRDLAEAIEPALELVELRSVVFDLDMPAFAWLVLSRRREVPAQPSTVRDRT